VAILANMFGCTAEERRMRSIAAKDAKYGFGKLIDLARAEPVAVAKHGRPVVVVMAIEEYERLKALEQSCAQSPRVALVID
jgi:prevent-host-death family protein